MSKHNYNVNSHFNGVKPSFTQLHKNLASSSLPNSLDGIHSEGDDVIIEFQTDLSAAEVTLLDTEIAKPIIVEKSYKILETIMLVPTRKEVKNKSDWQDFGGVVVSPSGFGAPVSSIKGQITGEYAIEKNEKHATNPAEISMLETGSWNMVPDSELIFPPHVMPPTNDMWLPFTAFTDVPVRPGFWSYVFRARRGKAEDFYLRHLTMSIVTDAG